VGVRLGGEECICIELTSRTAVQEKTSGALASNENLHPV